MSYRWEICEPSESLIDELKEAGGVSRATALALASLGIAPSRIAAYLRPTLAQLSDPYELPGTKTAAERLWQAVRRQERILVYGDYDTDGITATVLVAEVLSENGARVDCYLPHRVDDGYGLTAETLERATTPEQSLMVTVDCGISCHDAIAAANARGMDTIVTDHHEPHDTLPDALVVIDPKAGNAPPAYRGLAGVGVAFKLCHAFIKYGRHHGLGGQDTDLRNYLDLVTLGTVADIVPLLEENRCLVTAGLGVLSRQHRPGIRALCEVTHLREHVRTSDITFRLAPRINAAGRLGNPDEAFQLLHSQDTTEAYHLAVSLDARNKERQTVEAQVLAEAEEQIQTMRELPNRSALVVRGETWHQGVIGIVASRLVRKYNRPSLVLTTDPSGQLCGSGRSVENLNLVTLLGRCERYLERFGGHAMAAGLALSPEHFAPFAIEFERMVRTQTGGEAPVNTMKACGRLRCEELTDRVFEEMDMLAPFGHCNPEPLYVCHDVTPERVCAAKQAHTRGALRAGARQQMAFILFGTPPEDLPPPPWDIVFTPQLNRYNGSVSPQLKIADVRTAIREH